MQDCGVGGLLLPQRISLGLAEISDQSLRQMGDPRLRPASPSSGLSTPEMSPRLLAVPKLEAWFSSPLHPTLARWAVAARRG